MAEEASLVKLEDFDGEVEEQWQDAEGSKVLVATTKRSAR